mgnify:CR=1 FL=1
MPTALGRGQCGGHITLIFTIEDEQEDPLSQGSRGVGLCLEDGAEVIAKGEDGNGALRVIFQNGEYDVSMYEDVLDELIKLVPEIGGFDWELNVRISLPTSQGFGMSASGAIASAISIQRAIGIPHEECLRRSYLVAHLVERSRSSGLGDTTGLASGGVERRIVAGSPFSENLLLRGPGISEGWDSGTKILLLWRERTGKHTSNYIDDSDWKVKISNAGSKAMEDIGSGEWGPSRWSEIIEKSLIFASESELDNDSSRSDIVRLAERAIVESGFCGRVSALLCMLGESVVFVPKDYSDEGEWINPIANYLNDSALSTFSTKVGTLR